MNIRGKSIVELFDAKSNKCVERTVQENIITDVIERIINPADRRYSISASNLASDIASYMPFMNFALGGVVGFTENMPEDPNIIFPPVGIHATFHAGGSRPAGNTNLMRGSLNITESGDIPNGVRRVWDFETSNANGIIKCLALTNLNMGDSWCEAGTSHRAVGGTGSTVGANGQAIAEISAGEYVSFVSPATNPIELTYFRSIGHPRGIDMYQSNLFATEELRRESISLNSAISNPNFICNEAATRIVSLSFVNATTLRRVEIDIVNGALVSDTNITLSNIPSSFQPLTTLTNYRAVQNGNDMFIMMQTGATPVTWNWCRFNSTGVFQNIMTRSNGTPLNFTSAQAQSQSPAIINGKLYMRTFTLDGDVVEGNFSEPHISTASPAGYVASFNNSRYPFISTKRTDSGAVNHVIFNRYIGSINNLATPVTKTNATTMKVTYELTQV
jgi:hypothetical protein